VTSELADIGLVGLAVMGENLVLNMESRGFTVSVYNRTVSKVDVFTSGRAKGKKIVGTHSIAELVASLRRPRRVMLMVKAGSAVDDFIEQLLPHLGPGDIVIPRSLACSGSRRSACSTLDSRNACRTRRGSGTSPGTGKGPTACSSAGPVIFPESWLS
jgi:6-phosphogluconate dehydrogenase